MPIKAIINETEKEITRIPVLVHDIETAVYKDTWEVRDNQDRLLWYREDTLTGASSISYKCYGIPLKSMRIVGNGQQIETPSPDNIIVPTFCGKLVGTDWTIPITCTGQTVSVYLGQVETTRKIKKLVLTGEEETWTTVPGNAPYRISISDIVQTSDKNIVLFTSSHYRAVSFLTSWSQFPTCVSWLFSGDYSTKYLVFRDTNQASLDDFKSYLATQYENGTPVTVWYALATPETAIVNEPLAKIGDYADEIITIPGITPQTGTNTLTVGTTLIPSSVSITGHIRPTS